MDWDGWGGLDLFLRDRHLFQHYRYSPFDDNSIGSDAVLDVMEDRERKYLGSDVGGGLNLLNKKTGGFTRYQNNPADSLPSVPTLCKRHLRTIAGILWVATYYGGLNLFDPKTGKFTRLVNDSSRKRAYPVIILFPFTRTEKVISGSERMTGTELLPSDTRHFSHYFHNEEKMPDLRVLFSDSKGRLWVGQKGLYLLDAAVILFSLYADKAGCPMNL